MTNAQQLAVKEESAYYILRILTCIIHEGENSYRESRLFFVHYHTRLLLQLVRYRSTPVLLTMGLVGRLESSVTRIEATASIAALPLFDENTDST